MQITRQDAFKQHIKVDAHNVYNLVKNYDPNNHKCIVTFLLYRVWNAAKSVFGKSDWQEGIKLISKKIKDQFKPEFKDLPNNLGNVIFNNSKINRILEKLSENGLECMLQKTKAINLLSVRGNDRNTVDAKMQVINERFTSSLNKFQAEFFNTVAEIVSKKLKISKEEVLSVLK
jgi:hypothetical protein